MTPGVTLTGLRGNQVVLVGGSALKKTVLPSEVMMTINGTTYLAICSLINIILYVNIVSMHFLVKLMVSFMGVWSTN